MVFIVVIPEPAARSEAGRCSRYEGARQDVSDPRRVKRDALGRWFDGAARPTQGQCQSPERSGRDCRYRVACARTLGLVSGRGTPKNGSCRHKRAVLENKWMRWVRSEDCVRLAMVALTLVASACGGKAANGRGSGGAGPGGHAGQGTGGDGSGGNGPGGHAGQGTGGEGSGGNGLDGGGGRGAGGDGLAGHGPGGRGMGGHGGVGGAPVDAGVPDGPGSDVLVDAEAPEVSGEVCGTTRCQAGYPCCRCFGYSCSLIRGQCPAINCPAIPCGTTMCTPGAEACVHPSRGGTCTMPDAGQCPAGTAPESSGGVTCCLPPDKPKCIAIDRPCDGPGISCSCFSVDPCGSSTNACGGALIEGGDIKCRAG